MTDETKYGAGATDGRGLRVRAPRPPSEPGSWKIRAAALAVLVVAVGGFWLAGSRADTDTDDSIEVSGPGVTTGGAAERRSRAGTGIEELIPRPETSVLGQQPFGIDLEASWTGTLRVLTAQGEDIEIPADELTAVPELARLTFAPGEGKVVDRLPGGRTCVTATIHDRTLGPQLSERDERWCFSVL